MENAPMQKIENCLIQLLELSPVPMSVSDLKSGEFFAVNKKFEEWTGYSRDEIVGRKASEINLYFELSCIRSLNELLMHGGKIGNLEICLNKKNGEKIYGMFNSVVVENEGKELILSTAFDLTNKKEIENKLIDSEKKYRELFMNATDAIYLWKLGNNNKIEKLLETNDVACSMIGYTREELFGMLPQSFNPDKSEENISDIVDKIIKNGYCKYETIHQTKAGSKISVEINSHVFDFNSDRVIMSLVRDITSRKKMEKELLLTQFCVDRASLGVMRTDDNGKIVSANEYICQMLGYSQKELCEKYIYEIDANFSREYWFEHRSMLRRSKNDTFSTKHLAKSGKEIPVKITNSYIEFAGSEYSFSFVKDITESNKIKEDLLRTQFVIDNATDAIYWFDDNWKLVYVNESLCRLLGYTKGELLSMHVFDIDPDISNEDNYKKNKEKGESNSFITKSHHKTKNGNIFPVEISVKIMDFQGENFSCVFVRDITERYRAEQAIKENERLLNESQKIAKLGHYTFNARIGIWKNSPTLDEIFGIDESYVRNVEGWIDIVHPEQREEMHSYLINYVINGHNPFNREYKIINKKNNETKWVHGLGNVTYDNDDNATYMIGTIQDITVRKTAEERIKESLREKEILIKEVHHRVKNNLQVVSSLLYLQSVKVNDKVVAELFKESQNRVKSMTLIHEKLYQSKDLVEIDFNEYLNGLVSVLRESYLTNSYDVKIEINANGISLGIDVAIACGLILNELITNCLKHAFINKDNGTIKIEIVRNHNDIIISVIDDGIGIDTTKSLSEIQNLGLQIVDNLVRQIQGKLEISSDKGMTAKITFPVAA